MDVTQGNQPHPTEHHNLDERLEGLLIKLIDYTKLGTVSKKIETTMIQKDILKLAQWANSNKINKRGNAKFCV